MIFNQLEKPTISLKKLTNHLKSFQKVQSISILKYKGNTNDNSQKSNLFNQGKITIIEELDCGNQNLLDRKKEFLKITSIKILRKPNNDQFAPIGGNKMYRNS